METENETQEGRRVREALSPLEKVDPVALRPKRRRVRMGRLAGIAAAGVLVAAGAAFAASRAFDPSDAEQQPIATSLTCLGVIGEPAKRAGETLAARGYHVSWRFVTYGTQAPQIEGTGVVGVSGGKSVVIDRPRANTIVNDVAKDGRTVNGIIVLTQDPEDPNAPKLVAPSC